MEGSGKRKMEALLDAGRGEASMLDVRNASNAHKLYIKKCAYDIGVPSVLDMSHPVRF